jgi:hypothetical protein
LRLIFALSLLAALPSSAALLTYSFTGHVDTIVGVSGVAVGDPVLATFVFDNAAPVNDPPVSLVTEYQGGAGSLTVEIGSSKWTAPVARVGLVRFDVCIGGDFDGGPCEGARVVSTSGVTESGPIVFNPTQIFFGGSAKGNAILTGPEPFPLPADLAPLLLLNLEGQIAGGADFIYYTLDPPADVPEPATWIAGCMGLLVLTVRRRG